ncbi:MAG: hypothetical protein ACQEXJ_02160 [Myxococcota bacterium]
MADSEDKDNVYDMSDMLEAERNAPPREEPEATSEEDDGLVTSAPDREEVGSLLTDLLNEAKKEVEKERASLKQQIQDREEEAHEAQQREEALRREHLQRELMEETRRRNEALLRREREEAAARAAEEEKARRQAAALQAEQEAAETAAAAPESKKSRTGLLALVGVVAIGAGVGVFFLTQPKEQMQLPDVQAKAQAVIDDATLKYKAMVAEQKAQEAELRAAREAKAAREAEARRRLAEKERMLAEAEAREVASAKKRAEKEKEAEARRRAAARRRHKAKEREKKIKIKGIFD